MEQKREDAVCYTAIENAVKERIADPNIVRNVSQVIQVMLENCAADIEAKMKSRLKESYETVMIEVERDLINPTKAFPPPANDILYKFLKDYASKDRFTQWQQEQQKSAIRNAAVLFGFSKENLISDAVVNTVRLVDVLPPSKEKTPVKLILQYLSATRILYCSSNENISAPDVIAKTLEYCKKIRSFDTQSFTVRSLQQMFSGINEQGIKYYLSSAGVVFLVFLSPVEAIKQQSLKKTIYLRVIEEKRPELHRYVKDFCQQGEAFYQDTTEEEQKKVLHAALFKLKKKINKEGASKLPCVKVTLLRDGYDICVNNFNKEDMEQAKRYLQNKISASLVPMLAKPSPIIPHRTPGQVAEHLLQIVLSRRGFNTVTPEALIRDLEKIAKDEQAFRKVIARFIDEVELAPLQEMIVSNPTYNWRFLIAGFKSHVIAQQNRYIEEIRQYEGISERSSYLQSKKALERILNQSISDNITDYPPYLRSMQTGHHLWLVELRGIYEPNPVVAQRPEDEAPPKWRQKIKSRSRSKIKEPVDSFPLALIDEDLLLHFGGEGILRDLYNREGLDRFKQMIEEVRQDIAALRRLPKTPIEEGSEEEHATSSSDDESLEEATIPLKSEMVLTRVSANGLFSSHKPLKVQLITEERRQALLQSVNFLLLAINDLLASKAISPHRINLFVLHFGQAFRRILIDYPSEQRLLTKQFTSLMIHYTHLSFFLAENQGKCYQELQYVVRSLQNYCTRVYEDLSKTLYRFEFNDINTLYQCAFIQRLVNVEQKIKINEAILIRALIQCLNHVYTSLLPLEAVGLNDEGRITFYSNILECGSIWKALKSLWIERGLAFQNQLIAYAFPWNVTHAIDVLNMLLRVRNDLVHFDEDLESQRTMINVNEPITCDDMVEYCRELKTLFLSKEEVKVNRSYEPSKIEKSTLNAAALIFTPSPQVLAACTGKLDESQQASVGLGKYSGK